MKRRIVNLIFLFILIVFLIPGCVFVSRDFRMTRNDILNEIGEVDIETEVQLQIGIGLLSISRMAVSFTDAGEEAADYLRDVRNVQLGVYKLSDVDRNKPLVIPPKIAKKLAKKGYEPMVKAKERNSVAWVMTKMCGKRLTSLYVIVLERDELVLVEVKGRLGRLIEKAIHDHGFKKKDFKRI